MKVAIIGLGYVGLPLAVAFSEVVDVIGYDVDSNRIFGLKSSHDSTNEISNKVLKNSAITYTNNELDLIGCDFYIVTVPTPVNDFNEPDLRQLINASEIVGRSMHRGAVVVFESTVFPGCTEEICIPAIEKMSSLKVNSDFFVGYSPERVNPADKNFKLQDIKKIVAGSTHGALIKISNLYKKIINAGVVEVSSIKVAEAAKISENIQRDVNIALINELSKIFSLVGIDTNEVVNAAASKWNYVPYRPGLVGGHCIAVDPYYMINLAKKIGAPTPLMDSARLINNSIPLRILFECLECFKDISVAPPKVGILGLTFKENCPDFRSSRALELVKLCASRGILVSAWDPYLDRFREDETLKDFFVSDPVLACDVDILILAVNHKIIDECIDSWLPAVLNRVRLIHDVKGHYSHYLKDFSGPILSL